jgi:hypothetical protein
MHIRGKPEVYGYILGVSMIITIISAILVGSRNISVSNDTINQLGDTVFGFMLLCAWFFIVILIGRAIGHAVDVYIRHIARIIKEP